MCVCVLREREQSSAHKGHKGEDAKGNFRGANDARKEEQGGKKGRINEKRQARKGKKY